MSTSPVLALTSIIEKAFAAPVVPLAPTASLLGRSLAAVDPVRLAAALQDLAADAALTAAARSHDDFCDALKAWGRDLVDLAELLLAPALPVAAAGKDLLEVLVVGLLRQQYPRLAAVMDAAGVFDDDPLLGSRFNWDKLRDFVLSTPDLVDEEFWDEMFGDSLVDLDITGRMPALFVALLVVAPQTIAALGRGDLRIAGLEAPPVPSGASPEWTQLRERSAGWVAITHPLVVDNGELHRAQITDLSSGFTPDQALSLLIRSRRRPAAPRPVTDFEIWMHPSVDAESVELALPGDFVARLEPGVRAGFGFDGDTGHWNAAVAPRPGLNAEVTEATFSIEHPDTGAPDVLIGPPDDTRLIVRDVGARLQLRQAGEPSVELVARAKGFGVVLTNRWFRSLGEPSSSLREGVRLDADIEVRISEAGGLSVATGGALEFRRMSGKSLGLKAFRLTIHSYVVRIVVRADQDDLDVRAEVRPHWSATLGPATLVMDGAGGWLGWWADQPGDSKHCVGLLPPTGVGFQLQLERVTAGGFLDFTHGPTDRYGGVVHVAVKPPFLRGVTITAFGLHELAGGPDDDRRDRTLIVVLGITFRPGVAVGPGMILFGAGGLFGHDRRADTDALRERLTSGAVGNLLFADDPVRNAPLLLGDLRAIFPPKAGVHVFGLTVQLGWVPLFDDYFVRLALGLIFEYQQGLSKVIVLGSVRIRPPKLEKVLDIQVDAIGVIDVDRETVEIDVTIRRGLALGVFKITGDGGLRASWGAQKYLAATLGGFHPDFNPAPAVFPKLKRVLLTFYKEDLPGPIDELSASGYLAVTTNTLQAGLELKAAIKSGNWKIEGTIGGDALIRMPFSFDISLHGGVHVKYRGHNLIGVSFKGGISGPSPITLRGEVCVSLLLFDACWGDSIELGGGDDLAAPAFTTLVPVLAGELALASNVAVTAPEDDLVVLTRRGSNGRQVLSPLGAPTWTQNRMPLGFPIETFESGSLDDTQRLEVFASRPSTPFRDLFSPGSFVVLSDAEAMALPAFEEHQSGVVVTAEATRSAGVTKTVEVDEIRLPERRRRTPIFEIPGFVLERAQSTSTPTSVPPSPGRFSVAAARFDVVAPAGSPQEIGLSAVQARLASRGSGGAVQHRADATVVL